MLNYGRGFYFQASSLAVAQTRGELWWHHPWYHFTFGVPTLSTFSMGEMILDPCDIVFPFEGGRIYFPIRHWAHGTCGSQNIIKLHISSHHPSRSIF